MAELIVVTCPHCQKQLKAPSDRIGRTAKCPQCQQSFTLGEGKAPTGSASGMSMAAAASGVGKAVPPPPAPPAAKPAPTSTRWTLKIPTGETYGPIERTELDHWFSEGRINAECQLLNEGSASWQWASDIYPSLGGAHAVPQAPQNAPQIGAAVSAGVAKGWNALGGFMDNMVGQIENNYASPQTTNFQAEPQFTGPLEIQWQSVVAGLRVTKWSLLLGAAALLVLTLFGLLASMIDRPSGGFAKFLALVVLYCGFVTIAAFFGNLVGWLVQTEIPARARSRKLLQIALAAFASIFALLSLLFILGIVGPDSPLGSVRVIAYLIIYGFPLIIFGGLGSYAVYLHTTNLFFGRNELRTLVMISWGLLGGTYFCYILVILIGGGTLAGIIAFVQAVLFSAGLAQLGLMSHHLKQVIQSQQAQS
jgi:hypothetical protein